MAFPSRQLYRALTISYSHANLSGNAKLTLKTGVLEFGYSGFKGFERKWKESGNYSINLGDNSQSIASRYVLNELGISDVIGVDRDNLKTYSGERCAVVMNGVFFNNSFPPSPDVTPIFVGFCANENVISGNVSYLKAHEPIGCRDTATRERLLAHGIKAYLTGCVTMALPKRDKEPEKSKLFIVYGHNVGALPPNSLRSMPVKLGRTAEFISHRQPVWSFPIDANERLSVERYEKYLLERFRDEATLMLTSLHHVAAPCVAMGIPVILCRYQKDDRFSLLKQKMPVYYPGTFGDIDWNPGVADFSEIKTKIFDSVRQNLERLGLLP